MSGFLFVLQTDAAADSSRSLGIRKSAYTAEDHEYLQRTLDALLAQKSYDEAYKLCFNALKTIPVKYLGSVHLTLGKLSLENTVAGMPRNEAWAKSWFIKVIEGRSGAANKSVAREYLSSLAGNEQNVDAVSTTPLVRAKRSCRSFATVEPLAKARDTKQHVCPQCPKTFDSLRALRIHQTLKGHREIHNSNEALDSVLLFQQSQPVAPSVDAEVESDIDGEDFGFLELSESELARTCFECNKICTTIQALRGHEWHKHKLPKRLKEKQDAKRLKESKPVISQFCPECGDAFKSTQALGSHRKYKH